MPSLRRDEFWALRDISFDLKRGEVLGVIGRNGSGKTTLLRLVNGIFPPDAGEIRLRGRVGALIALNAGFHPHMTGRENIFLQGAILGMHKEEMREKYARIVEFAELGDFVDAPVTTYSSGMTVRLGFSIAIHLDPDLLIMDEVLAVGDVGFQKKCQERLEAIRDSGTPILFVSHNMIAVQRLCEKAILLNHGEIVFAGQTNEAVAQYYEIVADQAGGRIGLDTDRITHKPAGAMDIYVKDVEITGRDGQHLDRIVSGSSVRFRIHLRTRDDVLERSPLIFIRISDPQTDTPLAYAYVPIVLLRAAPPSHRFEVTCDVPSFNLGPGLYELQIKVGGASTDPLHDIAVVRPYLRVVWSAEVAESMYHMGKINLMGQWQMRTGVIPAGNGGEASATVV